MNGHLTDWAKPLKVKDHSTAATGDVTSDAVDMLGYDGVVFLTSYGTAAADNLMHAESSSDNFSSDTAADIAGSEVDLSGSSDEDQFVDIIGPPERYVRVVAQRGTSSTLESIWAIRYRTRNVPETSSVSGTIYGKKLLQPANGTK